MAIGRWLGKHEGLALAFCIAFGIGVHNFGEGLAIGGTFSAGSAGNGTFLVLGSILQKVTGWIGVAALILHAHSPFWSFAAPTLLADGPAVSGIWSDSLVYAPQWSALALVVGAGVILQLIVEDTSYLLRQNPDRQSVSCSPAILAGFLGGIAFMYATMLFIKV